MRVFSDTYFFVYALGFCPFTEKFGSEKNFIFAYIMHCPIGSMGKLRYDIILYCTRKILCMKHQICCTDIFRLIFFLQPQITVYISSSVTIHLLGVNTESAEFQTNSTEFKLVSGYDIRFEQIKTILCVQGICPCFILEVGGKDHNVLFFFV